MRMVTLGAKTRLEKHATARLAFLWNIFALRLRISFVAVLLLVHVSGDPQSSVLGLDQARLEVGEAQLRELESKASHSPCWRDAVSRLDHSCKQLNDVQQSRLAVAFANCHLDKSGRQTYPCSDDMTIRECTGTMDTDAYQTYTHFFTHTGHICYFLQIELWQGRTEGLIDRLSDTSSETVRKLEQSLDYHRLLDEKQDTALRNQDVILEQDKKIASSLRETHRDMAASFSEMSAMAESQKALLGEMFSSLQSSVEAVRSLMSLMLVEFIGWETVAVFCVSWLVVMLLPQFHYSRFKMMVVLLGEVMMEVCVRRVYGYLVLGGDTPPPNLYDLHSMLWLCRYVCAGLSLMVYVWEWYHYQDYGERNYRLLAEIRELLRTGRGIQYSTAGKQRIMKAPSPLPYVPSYTAQPPVAHGYTPSPPLPLDIDGPDTPDSTDITNHTPHHSHQHTSQHYVMCSDDEEMTSSLMTSSLIPDNDRAVKSKKTTRSTRGQRSSSRHHHVAVSQTPPPPSVMMTGHWSSGAEESWSQSLTRTPIHRHKTRLTKLTSPHRTTATLSSQCKAGGDDGNRLHTGDSEPEKEVTEEKKLTSPGSRRSFKSSSQVTQPVTTPTAAPLLLPPPSSLPRSRRSRSETPSVTSHRYNLRDRTPQRQQK